MYVARSGIKAAQKKCIRKVKRVQTLRKHTEDMLVSVRRKLHKILIQYVIEKEIDEQDFITYRAECLQIDAHAIGATTNEAKEKLREKVDAKIRKLVKHPPVHEIGLGGLGSLPEYKYLRKNTIDKGWLYSDVGDIICDVIDNVDDGRNTKYNCTLVKETP